MFVGMGLGRFSYTAMVPALVESGTLTAVAAGRVGMVNLAGFFLGAMISVPLARSVRRGTVLRVALASAVVGLAASALPWGVAWLAACRGAIGVSTSLIMVLSLALIAETAPADKRPAAAAYVFAGVGLGITSSGLLVAPLLTFGLITAWLGLVGAGLIGATLALWGWRQAPDAPAGTMLEPDAAPNEATSSTGPSRGLARLLLAHAMFSFGIVPHTLYWVDYLVRGAELGVTLGGIHWAIVGIFAVLGPMLTTLLAHALGTALALVVGLAILAAGVAIPALMPLAATFILSSMIFGAQPGISSLLAARARDLGDPRSMGRIMRAMILANAAGGVAGGFTVPWVYGVAADHAPVFLIGGAALMIGALAASPLGHARMRAS